MALVELKNETEALDIAVQELGKDLESALDFISAELAEQREKAQLYYNGGTDLEHDANRSKYVATVVRDLVRAVRPSLMRVFMSSATPVEFVPPTAQEAPIAHAQTEWAAQFFDVMDGYELLYGCFHDAMLKKLGVAKYFYDDRIKPIHREYTSLTQDQLMELESHPKVQILGVDQRSVVLQGPNGPQEVPIFDVQLVAHKDAGEICMKRVPLEEFLIDRNASCLEEAVVVAHRRNVRKSELVAMGFELEELEGLNSDNVEVSRFAGESDKKRGYTVFPHDNNTQDESMQEVLYTEAWYRADLDGDGIAEMYKFQLGGTDYTLLDYEHADSPPVALFAIDPEPGTIFGKCFYDLAKNEQDAMTSLIRATIDNFHMNNNPRLAVHEHLVNMDDVLSNELGAPIRFRSAGQIQVIDTPFTGAAALPLLTYLDNDIEAKTGVTKASAGLDPDALQSTDKDAVQNTIMQAQGQVELMARNLAESGMKDLCRGLLELSMQHLDPQQSISVNGQPQPIRLDVFDPTMKMRVRVGLGTGSYDERIAFLNETFAVQKEIMATEGPGNGKTSYGQMMNTWSDKARMIGVYNTSRYFNEVTPQQEQQMAESRQKQQQEQQQQAMQIQQAQAQALQQAEQIKAQAALQIAAGKGAIDLKKAKASAVLDAQGLEQKSRSDMTELLVKDDLARDQMLNDLYIKMAELQEDFAKANMQVSRAQGAN